MISAALLPLGVSVYVGGHANALADLANCLGVLPVHVMEHERINADYSSYTRSENSIRHAAVTGDFCLACDIDLFHTTPGELQSKLQALSLQGIAIALPDEASESPLDYLVFENGVKRSAVVLKDDETETVTIWRRANAG